MNGNKKHEEVVITNQPTKPPAKFPLGSVFVTPAASYVVTDDEIRTSLRRHVLGDWGEVCENDREENELSLREGFRLMSIYRTRFGIKYWIITEADRDTTTVLLPEDY